MGGDAMLLTLAIRGTAVLVGALLATALLRRASAATRHLVWTCAFACLLALPILWWSGLTWRIAVPSRVTPILTDTAVVVTSARVPAVSTPATHFDWSLLWY